MATTLPTNNAVSLFNLDGFAIALMIFAVSVIDHYGFLFLLLNNEQNSWRCGKNIKCIQIKMTSTRNSFIKYTGFLFSTRNLNSL